MDSRFRPFEPRYRIPSAPICRCLQGFAAAVVIGVAATFAPADEARQGGPGKAAAEGPPPAEELSLTTSDGVAIAAWYYPVADEGKPKATVIVIHDLDGSHETIAPLSIGLQREGYAVVAPDLRGHGASTERVGGAGRGGTIDGGSLRKPDLLAIAASGGGRIREQATARGDIEAIHGWIKKQSDSGMLDADRVCVVGSGAGGTLGALWTVADAEWPPTTSGPQGRTVRAIALVSPALSAKGGVSIQPAIKSDVFRRTLPILLMAGNNDPDAKKLTDQLKGVRPKEWLVRGPGQKRDQAEGVEKPADASIFCMHADSPLSGDTLASDATARAGTIIAQFFDIALERRR